MEREDIIAFLRSKKPELRERFGVEKIVLFGSYARNEATEESDIDLLVTMRPSFENFFSLQDYLEKAFDKKVDLGTKLRKFIAQKAQKEMIHI
jgi:predicted nucleotidyltransferase